MLVASPEARLDFFYKRHATYDERLNLYPIFRIAGRPALIYWKLKFFGRLAALFASSFVSGGCAPRPKGVGFGPPATAPRLRRDRL